MSRARTRIFFDGGCRPNPGAMEIAVVARGIDYVRRGIGHGSNDDAEWLALLYAVEIARRLGIDDVVFTGDSTLVVQQAAGAWKCRSPALHGHLLAYREAVAPIAHVRLSHVARSKNLAGIALARAHAR